MGENGKNGKNGSFTAAQFIEAIPGSGGIISTIAKRVGCAWHTAAKYVREMPTIAQAYRDECEKLTDMAESVVLKAIQSEDITTAKWYLTMKAKDRGYTERREVTGVSGGPVQTTVSVDYSSLSDDELCTIIARRSRNGTGEPDAG